MPRAERDQPGRDQPGRAQPERDQPERAQASTQRVRLATRDDAERCAVLSAQAVQALQPVRGGTLFTRRESGVLAKALLRPGGLHRLIDDPRRRVVVGAVGNEVAGLAVGRLDPVGEAAIGVVDGLYVDPEARGKGVGRALLEDLLAWFTANRCRGVDAGALPGDRTAKNFWEAAGFKARLLTMHRALQ